MCRRTSKITLRAFSLVSRWYQVVTGFLFKGSMTTTTTFWEHYRAQGLKICDEQILFYKHRNLVHPEEHTYYMDVSVEERSRNRYSIVKSFQRWFSETGLLSKKKVNPCNLETLPAQRGQPIEKVDVYDDLISVSSFTRPTTPIWSVANLG